MDEDRWAQLRECLSRGASTETWGALLHLFCRWPLGDPDLEMGLSYALEHLREWGPTSHHRELRVIAQEHWATPAARLARKLVLYGWEQEESEGFTDAPCEQLEALELFEASLEGPELRRFLMAPAFARLRSLVLHECGLTSQDLEALLQDLDFAPQLELLGLQGNYLDDDAAATLARSKRLGGLRELDLSHNGIGELGAKSLAQASGLGKLERLRLDVHPNAEEWVGGEGLLRLLYSSRLEHLQELQCVNEAGPGVFDLSYSRSWLDGLVQDSPASSARPLRCLILAGLGLDAALLEAILDSPRLQGIASLDLSESSFGDGGCAILAQSDALHRCEELLLDRCQIGDQGLALLTQSPHLSRLKVLSLGANRLGEGPGGALRALANSKHLGALERLDLSHNAVAESGARALAHSELLGLRDVYIHGEHPWSRSFLRELPKGAPSFHFD